MDFQTGKLYEGFKLIEQNEIKEINSLAMIFKHIKSGAQLLYIKNDDDNKVFSVTFRTPPTDSTGLPHILEHSVLCGSRKFPTKDPFVELAKGSLNTFLNAMTFSDKTMYPIASVNDADFYNLMNVYLDAVFYPNIYNKPQILAQEGWHYELDKPDEEIIYKGVVYNEMKGVFSSPEQVLFRKVQESLFPDTTYRYDSGGDPDVIPELTQKQFLDFHKKYYHPSNSYLYLYGNGNILQHLKLINEDYLNNFKQMEVDSKIEFQLPYTEPKNVIVEYPISTDESEEDKTFLSLNFVVGQSTDAELYMAFDILTYLLLHTSASPLKRALLEAGLGEDVYGSFDRSILQPVLSIVVKNTNSQEKNKFEEIVFNTLQQLVDGGIDKKLIEAAINIYEFKLRESDYGRYPKGLIYSMSCMDSWLYDENPLIHLSYENTLDKVKKALTSDYFEKLIDKYLLNNQHRSLLIVEPKRGLAQKKDQDIRNELADYKESLTDGELDRLIEETKKLKKYQEEANNPEELKMIPLISLEDIDKKPKSIPLIEKKEGEVPVLFCPIATNDIAYVNLLFDVTVVPQNLIPYVSLLSFVLGKVATQNYGYEDLSKEIDIYTGGMNFQIVSYPHKDGDKYFPKLVANSSALTAQIPKLFELLGEIIGSTKFCETNRLKEIIREIKSRLEMNILQNGHTVAARRATSYFSPIGHYQELCGGISFYQFIVDLERDFETRSSEIENNLQNVYDMVFNKDNLLVSVTTEEKSYETFRDSFSSLIGYLKNNILKKHRYEFDYSKRNEGLLTSSKIQYVAKAYNFKKLGYNYSGHLQVLKTIIGLDYLWSRVRVTGGAYGSMAGFSRNGNFYFTSYRDPNLRETLGVYDQAHDFIRNFKADDREMLKYIIGTISKMDLPLTPFMKGQKATADYISGTSQDDLERERNEVLNTSSEDIKKLSNLIKDTMDQNILCVLGNEQKIKENKDLFQDLVNVFK